LEYLEKSVVLSEKIAQHLPFMGLLDHESILEP